MRRIKSWGFGLFFVAVLIVITAGYYFNRTPKSTLADLEIVREGVPHLNKNLDTSDLPLKLKYIDLSKVGFPEAAGHVEGFRSGALILSRLGEFYIFENEKVIDLDTSVENNLAEYIDSYGVPGSINLRAHSFVINCDEGKLYAAFQRYSGTGVGGMAVSSTEFDCEAKNPFVSTHWTDLYFAGPLDVSYLDSSHAAGGGLAQDDEFLYISVGWTDGVEDPEEVIELIAQDISTPRGKVMQISKKSLASRVYSSGHRNLQDLIFLSGTSNLVAVEQGPKGGDELNLIVDGGNYGWPLKTYGTKYGNFNHSIEFNASKIPKLDDFEEPIFAFVPSPAASSLTQVGSSMGAWSGDLILGSLKGQSLYRLRLQQGRVIFSEPVWIGHRIRSMAALNEGLILLTDDSYLIDVSIDHERLNENETTKNLYATNTKCSTCHGFAETTPNSLAPSLKHIIGRKIGSTNYSKYSDALKAVDGVWDAESIMNFVENPQKFAPGTTMPKNALSSKEISEISDL
ncbi:MAG: PQQ-dependent sugar dehydrogenase, partial [Sneathiella sp.]